MLRFGRLIVLEAKWGTFDMTDLELAALLCSRLCHDLVGPVGAISNGVEILEDEEDPGMQRQAAELLAHSAGQAAGRLKFYRLAFGASGGTGARITLRDARGATQEFLHGSRTALAWADDSVTLAEPPGKSGVKLLLNLILVAIEAMPRGGQLSVDLVPGGASVACSVEASGTGVRLGEAAAAALRPGAAVANLDAKAAPAYLAARLAAAQPGALQVQEGAGSLRLTAMLSTAG